MRTPRESSFQPHTPLGGGSEFDVIRRMLERWGPRARRIGDDAAVITNVGDRALLVSTDTSVENVHFKREWLSPQEIGYRAAAAALSDLAAMGAKPLGMLCALAIPESWRDSIDAIGDGIGDAAEQSGTQIIGGDISRATELSLTFTVLGTARDVLFRTAARPGDRVYLTGRLGASGATLLALQQGRIPDPVHREKFAHPVPRIREAAWLAEHGAASAIDISDGLGADLAHLAAASRVKIVVDIGSVCTAPGIEPADAARSGEEYEIVVTSPADLDIIEFEENFSVELTRIGYVEHGPAGLTFLLDGQEVETPSGYLHFNG
jgi:thiamine-monophosphate kinase